MQAEFTANGKTHDMEKALAGNDTERRAQNEDVFSKDELAMACTSPALAAASRPFVDLLGGNTLLCKLSPFSKFYRNQLLSDQIIRRDCC